MAAEAADLIEVFSLGNRAYVVAYAAKKGVFNVYAIADDFSLSQPYPFFRNHEPGLSQGFSTLSSFTLYGQVVLLGYRRDNGYVAMYTVAEPASGHSNMIINRSVRRWFNDVIALSWYNAVQLCGIMFGCFDSWAFGHLSLAANSRP